MTAIRRVRRASHKLSMAEILEIFTATGRQPLRFTAYDGSSAGDDDAELGLGSSDATRRHLPGRPRPANSALPARTYRVTCRPTACIPAIPTSY